MSDALESIRAAASRLFAVDEKVMSQPTLIVHPNEDPRVRARLEARGYKLVEPQPVTEADMIKAPLNKEFKIARRKS